MMRTLHPNLPEATLALSRRLVRLLKNYRPTSLFAVVIGMAVIVIVELIFIADCRLSLNYYSAPCLGSLPKPKS